MTLDSLKTKLKTLPKKERRHVMAFLVSLEDNNDPEYRRRMAAKIDDRDEDNWVELDSLHQHVDLSEEVGE